jgi:hypothetical protein
MALIHHMHDFNEKQFLDLVMEQAFGQDYTEEYRRRKNPEAYAIFHAVQSFFDGSNMGKVVVVDPYLVHNLAACTGIAMEYNRDDHIPWDAGDHDHILLRTLRGFMRTVIIAIKEGRMRYPKEVGGPHYVEGFRVPIWLIQLAMKTP